MDLTIPIQKTEPISLIEKEDYFQDVAFDYYATRMALCGNDRLIKVYEKSNLDEGYEKCSQWEVF